MAKPELGSKRVCPACGTKYYDLNRDPIVCPSCGTVYELTAREKAAPAIAREKPEVETEEEGELETEVDVVSLEEVEEGDDIPDAEAEDAVPDLPEDEVLDVEKDLEDGEHDPFLEADEEEGDDVSGLLDVDADEDDEV